VGQCEWVIVVASGSNNGDAVFYVERWHRLTADFVPAAVGTGALTPAILVVAPICCSVPDTRQCDLGQDNTTIAPALSHCPDRTATGDTLSIANNNRTVLKAAQSTYRWTGHHIDLC
jgi:hypothetical protein